MIWPSNGRPKAKVSIMTDDSMMTVWVRKGLMLVANVNSEKILKATFVADDVP